MHYLFMGITSREHEAKLYSVADSRMGVQDHYILVTDPIKHSSLQMLSSSAYGISRKMCDLRILHDCWKHKSNLYHRKLCTLDFQRKECWEIIIIASLHSEYFSDAPISFLTKHQRHAGTHPNNYFIDILFFNSLPF